MSIQEIMITKKDTLPCTHKNEHPDYDYRRYMAVKPNDGQQCCVSLYEIPPGKSNYPYHHHEDNEEVFYIMSGAGVLKTHEGDRAVSAGDIIFCPATEKGAHKLTNTSQTETLVYIDFDTQNSPNVTFYPDSNKIGIYGAGFSKVFRDSDDVDYYEGE